MASCIKKYSPSTEYGIVKSRLLQGLRPNSKFNYKAWIEDSYPDDAKELIAAVDKLVGETEESKANAVAVLLGRGNEIEGAFGPRFQVGLTTDNPEFIEVDSTPVKERRTDNLGIRGTFISESAVSNPTAAYSEMINNFVKNVVEKVIYNPETKKLRDPNFIRKGQSVLNSELYQYKLDLMKDLWEKLYPSVPFNFRYTTDIDFTATINKLLTAYANKRKIVDPNNELFAKYMMLKNFNNILDSEFKNVIGVSKKYKTNGRHSNDMYEFLGGRVEHDTTWGDEFADASDYSGQIVKTLLNYFHGQQEIGTGKNKQWVDTNQAIGFATFCNLMTRVKEWAESQTDPFIQQIVHGDVNADWSKLIDRFLEKNKLGLTSSEIANLRGIQRQLMDNDSPELKEMFVNQAKKTIRYRYLITKPMFNPNTGKMEMRSIPIEDRLVYRQNFAIQSSVKNMVLRLRTSDSAVKNLKDQFDYEVTKDTITIKGLGEDIVINVQKKKDNYEFTVSDFSQIENADQSKAAKLIRLVLGQPIPKDVNEYLKGTINTNLLSIFIKPIALTLYASDKKIVKEINDRKEPISFTDGILDTFKYTGIFYTPAQLMSKIYRTTDTNVVRNENGDALPSYQIISSVYNMKEWIYRSKNESENQNLRSSTHDSVKNGQMFKENILYRDHYNALDVGNQSNVRGIEYQPIGQIYTRGDVTNDTVTKGTEQLTAPEVYQLDVFNNFYKRLSEPIEEGQHRSIILQPITFSDKKTHFLVEYMIDQMYINDKNKDGRNLSKVMSDLISTNSSTRAIAQLEMSKEIRYGRGMRAKRQLVNIMQRFQKQFKFTEDSQWRSVSIDMSNEDIKDNINYINNYLQKFTSIGQLRSAFNTVDFEETLDVKEHKIKQPDGTEISRFELNPILSIEFDLYLDEDQTLWNAYSENARRSLAGNLLKQGFSFNTALDPAIAPLLSTWQSALGDGWVDFYAGTMKAVRVLDKNGVELELYSDADIKAALYNKDGSINSDNTVLLHPIIEAHQLAHQLLSMSFVELLMGSTNSFTGKWNGPSIHDINVDYNAKVTEIEQSDNTDVIKNLNLAKEKARVTKLKLDAFLRYVASNLSDEFKRTVLAGAVKTPYAQGKKYGVSTKWKIASVLDKKGSAYNYTGDITEDKVQDGSSSVSSYVSKQENVSLREGSVGEGVKKSFINFVDPETGVLREIKHAEFTVTHMKRRASKEEERKYQLMHNLKLDTSKLSDFNASDYYDLNDVHYDEDNKRISHNTELFRKDRLTRKHYKINSLETVHSKSPLGKDVVTVIVHESEVDEFGENPKPEVTRKVIIDSIAKLDEIFGGAYSESKDPNAKRLVYDEASDEIVHNIICNHDLKDDMIAFVVNTSAQKVGWNNVNDSSVFDNDKTAALKYFEIETRYAGVQMNADHEIDEGAVSEMTQMMSSLIQAGFGKRIVKDIYSLIGRIAAKNISKYTDALATADLSDDLYLKLGKLFASSFVSGNKDSIGLAEAFIINAAKELDLGITENKIPFSSNQVKGIFQSTITSTLNALGIRRKFPGFGGINSPSFGIIQVFNINGDNMSLDEAEDWIFNDLQIRQFNGSISQNWNIDNVFSQQRSNPLSERLDNPYIERLDKRSAKERINIEDTVILRQIGDTGDGQVIRIRDINTLDTILNFTDFNNTEVYIWKNQPKELRQSINTVTITDNEGKSLRIKWTDLDSVRASFYLGYYDVNDKYRIEKDGIIRKVLAGSGLENADLNDKEVRKKALLWARKITSDFTRGVTNGYSGTLPLAYSDSGLGSIVKFSGDIKQKGQIVMGKANMKALNLLKGDKLSEIKDSSFFTKRLVNKFNLPLNSEYDKKLYDLALFDENGRPMLVIFGDVYNNIDRLHGCVPSNEYIVNSDGFIEKNGVELYGAGGKAFYKSGDGKYDILVVDDEAALKDVLNARQHQMVRYNYTPGNWKKLYEFTHPKQFVNGQPKNDLTIGKTTFNKKDWDSLTEADMPIDLLQNEDTRFSNAISDLALKQFRAFKAQLNYILTRIPSQSMQSYMDVEVVWFTDSELNEVYVPRALTYIQGSDYDIDKDYMMGFGLLPDGTLPTLSDLENEIDPNTGNEYDPFDILALVAPSGRTFKSSGISSLYGITKEDVDSIKSDIKNLNKILRSNNNNVVFRSDVSLEDRTWIIDLLNKHEASKRNGRVELLGLQNTVVRGILSVLSMPETQLNMSNPISMDDLKDIAKGTALADDEKTMTLDDPFTIYKMQQQNMVGRAVIGVGAVSMKSFFETSYFFNQQLQEVEDEISQYRITRRIDRSKIVDDVLDLCFDHKFDGSIITLANLDFKNVKNLLYKYPDLQTITVQQNLKERYIDAGRDGLFVERENGKPPFITVNEDGSSTIRLLDLIEHLDSQSNGKWDSPIDAAFALSELISAATDNAKELILAKINATTMFADVWTYLITTGMPLAEIGKIMANPLFNVVAHYAESNIFNNTFKADSLEASLKFILDEKSLTGVHENKWLWLLTNLDKGESSDRNESFLLSLVYESNSKGIPIENSTKEIPNNVLRRWWISQLKEGQDPQAPIQDIVAAASKVISNKWDDNAYDYKNEFKRLMRMIYEELHNPEVANKLLTFLSSKVGDTGISYDVDPELLLFGSDEIDDPELFNEFDDYGENGFEDFDYHSLDSNSARTFYQYVKNYLIPKNGKTGILSEEDRKTLKSLLENVIPAMKEQQLNGQILGVNQGVKTQDYDEFNWIRKIDNFVNQRYVKFKLPNAEPFTLLTFLTDEEYQKRQIDQYEKVKSTSNILKSVMKTPHFREMLKIVRVNRQLIERAAALRIERDLAEKVLAEEKSMSGNISSGYFFKFNPKEYSALQRVVSDSLIFSWISSIDGLELVVPAGQKFYDKGGKECKSKPDEEHIINFKTFDELASFKSLMEDYIIPQLIARYGDTNAFFANLTPGFRRDSLSGLPVTFYKPAFNISDVSKSPKLQNLYDGIAKGFNEIYNVPFMGWKIGDLFYLYNLLVHKESLGGDSFTKLFEEMTTSNNRHSLVYSYNSFLSELDNGKYRWKEAKRKGSIISYGDYVKIDLRDIRLRCCISDASQKKFRVKRTTDEKGKLKSMQMTRTKMSDLVTGTQIKFDSLNRTDYTLNLYYAARDNTTIPNKKIDLGVDSKITYKQDSLELLNAIVDNLKNRLGLDVPIHIVNSSTIENIPAKIEKDMYYASGFVIGGQIYINSDNIDIFSPIHELMHIVCAAMKYGTPEQRTLYYRMLKQIDLTKEEWSDIREDIKGYNLVGSDLQEEALIRAMTKMFAGSFKAQFDSYIGVQASKINTVVNDILEKLLAVSFSGRTKIEDIARSELGQVLAVFNSQFEGSDRQRVSKVIVPTNQQLAKLKKNLFDSQQLTFNGDC